MNALIETLKGLVGTGHCLDIDADKAPFLTDWRGRYTGNALAVVFPADAEEVSSVVCACAAAQCAVVPQGGNTGLCGGATPLLEGESVVLNLSRMRKIRMVDAANNAITVEAGVPLAVVQAAAEEVDRLFPLSLASEGSCEVGGFVSTNAGGVQVLRYGNTRELVLGLEVVLPDGRIWNGLRALRKDNTGYDLKQLFIGAEGTLGIVTRAVLRLEPLQRPGATALLGLPDVDAAITIAARLRREHAERLFACEILWHDYLQCTAAPMGDSAPSLAPCPLYLLVELAEDRHLDAGPPGCPQGD